MTNHDANAILTLSDKEKRTLLRESRRNLVTIYDVAKKAGVSKSTVSRVITNTGSIKDSTRARVEDAMRELNYVPSYLAQGIRTGRTKTIAFLVEDNTNLYYNEVLHIITGIAAEHDYMVFLINGNNNQIHARKYASWLKQRQIDGVICCFYQDTILTDELYRMSQSLPVVFLDNPKPLDNRPNISCIGSNGLDDIAEIVRFLYETGSRRIAFVGINGIRNVTYRYLGYRASMTACGCELDDRLIFIEDRNPAEESYFSLGQRAARALMAQENPPDANNASTDNLDIGALQYLRENGWAVPEQVRLTGYDNLILSTMCKPRLSTVNQPIEKIAKEAMRVLMEKIQNSSSYNHSTLFKSEFIQRETT